MKHRKCHITGEGYCIQDGLMYIKYESDLIKHLRSIEPMECSDEFLLSDYYQSDYYYWTEWDDDELEHDVEYIALKNVEHFNAKKQSIGEITGYYILLDLKSSDFLVVCCVDTDKFFLIKNSVRELDRPIYREGLRIRYVNK